jgi:hypothetical protein
LGGVVAAAVGASACGDPGTHCPPAACRPDAGAGDVSAGPRAGRQAAGPWAGQRSARFDLRSAASRVTLRVGEIGADLYRIGTPAGAGLAPVVTRPAPLTRGAATVVTAALRPTGLDGPHVVEVTLRPEVWWDVRLGAGAGEFHLDLAAARLTALTVLGGAGALRLWLPRPDRRVPVVLGAGTGDADVWIPAGVPVHTHPGPGAGYLLASSAVRPRVHR